MDLDAALDEIFHLRDDVDLLVDAEHVRAQIRVGGVNRDVLRREPLLDYPLDLGLSDRRQRRIVAVHEREPDVLVAHPQRRARAFGVLLYEAEDAIVAALPRRHRLEIDAPGFALVLFDLDPPFFAAGLDDFDRQFLFSRRQELEVERVAHPAPVDRPYAIADFQFQFGGERIRLDADNLYTFRHSINFSSGGNNLRADVRSSSSIRKNSSSRASLSSTSSSFHCRNISASFSALSRAA